VLTDQQALSRLVAVRTGTAAERLAVLEELLELPDDRWTAFGVQAVDVATVQPGTPGRAALIDAIGRMPLDVALPALRSISQNGGDPDRLRVLDLIDARSGFGMLGAAPEIDEAGESPFLESFGGPSISGESGHRPGPPTPPNRHPPPTPPPMLSVPVARPAPGLDPPSSPASEPAPDSAPDPAPDTVYPRLDAPDRVAPGDEFTVTVGLRPEADTALVSTGAMTVADAELQVALQFDPLAFVALGPAVSTLRRTAQNPWPAVDMQLIARQAPDLRPERRVEVKFLRDGALLGFASRTVVVAEAGATPPAGQVHPLLDVTPPAERSIEHSTEPAEHSARRSPEPSAMLDLAPLLDEDAPDLIVVIRPAADVVGTRLVFTAHSRHDDVADQPQPATEVLVGEHTGGTTPQQLGIDARLKVSTTSDERNLFTWLRGLGDRVYRSIPAGILGAIREAVAKGTAQAPATILVLSEEPYVPWELAVDPAGWPSEAGTTSPFLGAHAAVGRWFLGDVPPPPPRPSTTLDVREKALVTAHYEGVAGWNVLPFAEAEVADLRTALAPDVTVVNPVMGDVLDLLGGTPPADLMHFALHGTFDPQGIQGGLVLLKAAANGIFTPELLQENNVRGFRLARSPFVYLNACQVAAGDSRTLGDYGGLAAAFLASGACAVLAPLWNVKDETASDLAREFYRLATAAQAPSAAEIVRRFRARYTEDAVKAGTAQVDATLVAFQLFGHPRMRLTTTGTGNGGPHA
jgi:hypothetical protein